MKERLFAKKSADMQIGDKIFKKGSYQAMRKSENTG